MSNTVIESIISITRERDRTSLEHNLVETLSKNFALDTVFMLKVSQLNIEEHLEISSFHCRSNFGNSSYRRPRINMPLDKAIIQVLQSQQVLTEIQGKAKRRLYPVVVEGRVINVLMIQSEQLSNNCDQMVSGFLQVYTNFIALMLDNDHDKLTGLLNRRAFDSQLNELLLEMEEKARTERLTDDRRSLAADSASWVSVLDIDHFKHVNDTYGHLYGDEVLVLFASIMRESFRQSDLLFRYGGEEFVVILISVSEQDALMVLERFRRRIESYSFPRVGQVTVSIGAAGLSDGENPTVILEQADQALYYAKEHGRNQVSCYHQLTDRS